jgi:hypothetical protein
MSGFVRTVVGGAGWRTGMRVDICALDVGPGSVDSE